jgi:hypothetical protein
VVTEKALGHAAAIGARAGDTYRQTGITQPNPFTAYTGLSRASTRPYVDAAYKPTIYKPTI